MNTCSTCTNGLVEADSIARPNRRIFRTEAIDRYCRDYQRSVIPQFVRPRTFVGLWLLLVLVLLCCGLMIRRILPQHLRTGIGLGALVQSSAQTDSSRFGRFFVEGGES